MSYSIKTCERHLLIRCPECVYIQELEEENAKLKAENEQYRKALEFYADLKNHKTSEYDCLALSIVDKDHGYIARQALKEGQE